MPTIERRWVGEGKMRAKLFASVCAGAFFAIPAGAAAQDLADAAPQVDEARPTDIDAMLAVDAQHIGSYNSSFPNTPGRPSVPLSTFGKTDAYSNVNLSFGLKKGDISAQFYLENLFDDHSITYIHPEAFLVSRFGTMRPRTFGIASAMGFK